MGILRARRAHTTRRVVTEFHLLTLLRTRRRAYCEAHDVLSDIMQKDGLWGEERGLISTSAAIFGPADGPKVLAVLFINSDIIGGPRDRARGILQRAYNDAKLPVQGATP